MIHENAFKLSLQDLQKLIPDFVLSEIKIFKPN